MEHDSLLVVDVGAYYKATCACGLIIEKLLWKEIGASWLNHKVMAES